MYTNHRHYILFFFALATLVASVIGYEVLYRTVTSQSARTNKATREIALADERKQREEDTASVYTKTAEERARLGNLIISQEKVVDFIQSVEKIGNDVNVQIELSAITREPVSTETAFGYFKGHIEARGSWANVMRSLMLIENMPYSISLSNFRLTQSSESFSTELPVKGSTGSLGTKGSGQKTWSLSLDIRVLTKEIK